MNESGKWYVEVRLRQGNIAEPSSTNIYEYTNDSDAMEAAFAACDTLEQTLGVKAINGEETM